MSHDNDNDKKLRLPPHEPAWSQVLTGNQWEHTADLVFQSEVSRKRAWVEDVIDALSPVAPMVTAEEQEHEEQPFCVSVLGVVATPQFTLRDWNRRVWLDVTSAKDAGRTLCLEGYASSVEEAMRHRTICGKTGSYHCEGECDLTLSDALEGLQGPPPECAHGVDMGGNVAEAFIQGFRDAMFGEVCDD